MVTSAQPKFFYGIPNSQNPSGRTYSQEKRRAIAEILREHDTVFYEDDAFGELFFDAKPRLPVRHYLPGQAVMTGSFSKTVAPGMRIGWMFAPKEILAQFNVVKQASDLHSNFLCQKILHRYLTTSDPDGRIHEIVKVYERRCRQMCDLFDDLMPELSHTTPEGGMFLMATLPPGLSSRAVFDEGVRNRVAVLPGLPFYVDSGGTDTIRLNFSSASEEQIAEGMHRLSKVIHGMQHA
jgi:2-aminoadipate transaminase